MPTEIFNQLKTLREGIAESLKKDPRYLTLHALDKSIAEIGGVLSASGLMTESDATPPTPFSVEPGTIAPGGTPQAGAAHDWGSKPLANGPLASASTGAAADPHAELLGKPIGTTASKSTKPIEEDEGDSDEEPEPAGSLPEHQAAADHPEATTADVAPSEQPLQDAPAPSFELPLLEPRPEVQAVVSHEGETHPQEPLSAPPATAEFAEGTIDEGVTPTDDHDLAPPADLDHEALLPGHVEADAPHGHSEVFHGWASGYKAMAAKPGAAQYQPSIAVKFGRLPAKVDLRPLLSPIEDQGDIRSCVACAVAGAYEAWLRRTHKHDEPASRLFIYYNARWRDGTQDEDEGSAIQLAMEGLCRFGACSEALWPSDPHLALKKPGAAAYEAAAAYRVADIARMPLKLEAWKQALAEGKPIVFGCELFESFEDSSRLGGVVPMPAPHDVAHAGHSGHAMCAVGYSDIEKVFIVRNSWSAQWGDGGYCYMPYAYLLSPTFNDGDCWVFVPKIPAQPPRETWSDATSPVTNAGAGIDFAIETHTTAEYDSLGVDLFAAARHAYVDALPQDYAATVDAVAHGRWNEIETFDVSTYLAVAAALNDVDLLGGDGDLAAAERHQTEHHGGENVGGEDHDAELRSGRG